MDEMKMYILYDLKLKQYKIYKILYAMPCFNDVPMHYLQTLSYVMFNITKNILMCNIIYVNEIM